MLSLIRALPFLLIAFSALAEREILYVRPTGACANNGNGTAYTCAASAGAAGAWIGMASVVQASADGTASAIDDDDVLYICGTHTNAPRFNTAFLGGIGLPSIIDGACPGDPGTYDGRLNATDDRLLYINHSHWTVQNITCYNPGLSFAGTCVTIGAGGLNVIVQDSVFIGDGVDDQNGVLVTDSNGPWTIRRNTFTGYGFGININGGSAHVSGSITDNRCDLMTYNSGDGGQCILVSDGDFLKALTIALNRVTRWQGECIDLNGGSNLIVENNVCIGPGAFGLGTASQNGIKMGGLGDGNIIRWNWVDISSTTAAGGWALGGGTSGTSAGENQEIYGNVVIGGQDGIVMAGVSTDTVDGTKIYNNTIVNQTRYGIQVSNFVNGVDLKNNVIRALPSATADIRVGTATGIAVGGNNALLTFPTPLVETGGSYTATGDIGGSGADIDANLRPTIGSALRGGAKPVSTPTWWAPHDYLGCRYDPAKPSIGAFEVCGGSAVARTRR